MKVHFLFLIFSFLNISIIPAHSQNNFDFFFSQKSDTATVVKIIRSDLFLLDNKETVQLIGVKSNIKNIQSKQKERDQYGFVIKDEASPDLTIEDQSIRDLEHLILGKKVRLEYDNIKKNADFHTYAYVFTENSEIFLNEYVLSQGYGFLRIRPPNTKYAEKLKSAYQTARKEKRGLHGQ